MSVDRSTGGYAITLNEAGVRSNTWSIKRTNTLRLGRMKQKLPKDARALIVTRNLFAESMFP